jgi:glutathione S-transferase
MKLYYDPITTSSRSVTFFLFDQRIDFQEKVVNTSPGEHRSDAFERVNPNQQVPVLEDDGFVLRQSSAIMKYVAEKVGSGTYPTGLRQRAAVNEAMEWFGTNFFTGFCLFLAYRRMLPPLRALSPTTHHELDGLGQAITARYLRVLDRHMLADRAYVAGQAVTIADYYGFTYVTLGELINFDFGPYANVCAWLARMRARDGYEAAYSGFKGLVQATRAHQFGPTWASKQDTTSERPA